MVMDQSLAGPRKKKWVLYQGPSTHLLEALPGSSTKFNVLISAWEEDRNYLDKLTQGKDRIQILSKRLIFRGPSNLNLQAKSTVAGLREIMRIGGPDTLVLKVRSDFEINPLEKALDILESEWLDALQQLGKDSHAKNWPAKNPLMKSYWIEAAARICGRTQAEYPILFYDYSWHKKGYFLDFMQFGRCEDLLSLWTIKKRLSNFSTKAPEEFLTSRFRQKFNVGAPGRSFLASRLFFARFYEEGIRVRWIKTGSTHENWKGHGLWSSASQFRSESLNG